MWSDCMADAYRDLIAWRKATDLALERSIEHPKVSERRTLWPYLQMRRPAVSVPSNIAEGKGRYSRKEFAQFLYRARGSLLELETQLFIAKELHYLEPLVFRRMEDRTKELGRILNGLINSVLEGINVAS